MLFDRFSLARSVPALGVIALLAIAGHPALAQGVVGTPTNVTLTAAPSNVTEGQHQDNMKVTAFTEDQSVVLTKKLGVDISAPGTYNSSVPATTFISKGTAVNSFYLYSDPSATNGATFTGSITFNADILGLEVSDNTLDNTDALLGLSGTTYPNGVGNRGLEINGGANTDSITLSADRRTLTWSFVTKNNVDGIRVLTAVPEPAMALPMGLMLLGSLVLWRRRSSSLSQ